MPRLTRWYVEEVLLHDRDAKGRLKMPPPPEEVIDERRILRVRGLAPHQVEAVLRARGQ